MWVRTVRILLALQPATMGGASKVQEILAAAKERRERAATLVEQSKRPKQAPSGHYGDCGVQGYVGGVQFVNWKK